MTTRTQNTLACIFALGLVLLAFCTMDRRDADATEESGYPEVVQEVVSPEPEVVWLGDSIKAVRTDLDPDGWIQGTVKEGER